MNRDFQVGGDHYTKMPIQPFDIVDTWPIEQQIGFHRGQLLKYTMRLGSKGQDIDDAKKAVHYARMLVFVMSEGEL